MFHMFSCLRSFLEAFIILVVQEFPRVARRGPGAGACSASRSRAASQSRSRCSGPVRARANGSSSKNKNNGKFYCRCIHVIHAM